MRLRTGRTYSLLACAIALLGIAGIYGFLQLMQTSRETEDIRVISIELLTCRRHEKDFLARKDLAYVEKHDLAFAKLTQAAKSLENRIAAFSIASLLRIYRSTFEAVVNGIVDIGLTEDRGLRGELRKAIHEVEETLSATDDDALLVLLLTCRRYEKDFIIRNSSLAVERFENSSESLLDAVTRGEASYDRMRSLTRGIQKYRDSFANLVAMVTNVGLDKDSGLRGEMRRAIHKAEARVIALEEFARTNRDQNRVRTIGLVVLLGILLMTSIVLLVKLPGIIAESGGSGVRNPDAR